MGKRAIGSWDDEKQQHLVCLTYFKMAHEYGPSARPCFRIYPTEPIGILEIDSGGKHS